MSADATLVPNVYSVLLTLLPEAEAVIPYGHGHQAYALFLNLLKESEPSLAEELHSSDGLKPVTLSPLQGKFGRAVNGMKIVSQCNYRLRLTFLRSDIFAHFLDGALRWGDRTIELGPAVFRMDRINTVMENTPIASWRSYKDIIDNASTERCIELEFISPTAFRSGGKRNVVFPEPQLVFGSYLNRWQAFSPVKLDSSISSWFENMVVARYKLGTRILHFGSYQEVGFTGRCRFEVDKNTPEEAVIVLNALADFAFYCGTGAKTTMGMGQTRRIKTSEGT